jgi:hypothetical protein
MAVTQLTGAPVRAEVPIPSSLRIVPARVAGAQVFVSCPSWCVIDHVAAEECHLDDVWHRSEYANLTVPRMGKQPELLAFARLGQDLNSNDPRRRVPHLFVDDGGEGHEMTIDQADEFADNLIAFADSIRALARTARGSAS